MSTGNFRVIATKAPAMAKAIPTCSRAPMAAIETPPSYAAGPYHPLAMEWRMVIGLTP
jgi:hypothetical protein